MKRVIFFTILFGFFSSLAFSSADVRCDEWIHPSISRSAPSMAAVRAVVVSAVGFLNGFELNTLESHPCILQGGRQTAYAKDHEVALCTLSRIYKDSLVGVKFADIGCGVGSMDLLMPFISDGSKPIDITLVEACGKYFTIFDKSLTGIRGLHPKNITFTKVPCMVQELLGTLGEDARGSFDAVTCMNMLHLLSDEGRIAAIRIMKRLLKVGGIVVASHMACNAGIFEERIAPARNGRYMAKVTADAKRFGVHNIVTEFVLLPSSDETAYSPQTYYVLEGDVYAKKSAAELMLLAATSATKEIDCYRYVHYIERSEFLRMFSELGFEVMGSGEYNFCDTTTTSFLADTASSAERMVRGDKGFYVVAKKLDS